jgi:hypothetical protein
MEPINTYPTLQRFISSGGTIDVGRIDVINCAAIASDESTLWVALTRRTGEGLTELLRRLDVTLAQCLLHGERVDELHHPLQ